MIKAVIDRVEEGKIAVILVEEEGLEFKIPVNELPKDIEEGVWLNVDIEDGELVVLEIDEEETEKRKNRIQEKIKTLRKRGSKRSNRLK
ncbi:MAG: DUF3006 domain-containing protein [Thermoproteota archaeon]